MADKAPGAMKGKITFLNSEDAPWKSSQGGTFYPWQIKIECKAELVEGQINFKTAESKYKVGDVITFDKVVDGKRTKIQNHKLAEDNPGSSGVGQKAYNDPLEIKHTAMSMSQMLVVMTYEKANEGKDLVDCKFPKALKNIDAMALKYYNWIIHIDPLTRDAVIRRAYAIERALAMKNYPGIIIDETEGAPAGINSSDDVLKVADHFFNQQQILV